MSEEDDFEDEESYYDYREDPDYLNDLDEEMGRDTLGVPGFSQLNA